MCSDQRNRDRQTGRREGERDGGGRGGSTLHFSLPSDCGNVTGLFMIMKQNG